jgi:integrase
MNPKTIANVWGALRTLLRDSSIEELIDFSPVMPRGIIPARQGDITEVYSNEDVAKLLQPTEEFGMDLFSWVALHTGMREGEICGLVWSDWEDDENPKRLGSLLVRRQYSGEGDDATTKTTRARRVPVHPLLAARLRVAKEVAESPVSAPIVPHGLGKHHTKSTAYKALKRHCAAAGVTWLDLHRTRHTAITAMRRGGAPEKEVERVTHNAKGSIVDRYTHDWTILCAVVSCIDYSSHGEFHGGQANLPSKSQVGPGSIPGASTYK